MICINLKVHHSTATVKRLNDLVREVTGKDETTVAMELLYSGPKGQLYVGSGVVCLVNETVVAN